MSVGMPPGNLVDKLRVLVQQTEARSTLRTSSGRTDSCNAWRQYFADRNTEWIKRMDDPFAPGELEQWAAGMPDKLEPRQPRATQTNAEAAVKAHIERALEDSIRAAVGKVEKGINVKIGALLRRDHAEELLRCPRANARGRYTRWLSEEPDPRGLMRQFPDDLMRMWPISTRVNKLENEDPFPLGRFAERYAHSHVSPNV